MKNIKFFAMAAALAVIGLASCQKGNNGLNGPETASQLGISLELPGNYFAPETRADQDAIDPTEVAVETIHVWVFNNDGTPAANGHFSALDPADDFTTVNNLMTQTDNFIEVTASGNATVYVGLNVPSAAAYANEGALLQDFRTLAALTVASEFTMFSAKTAQTLTPYVEDDATTITEVEVVVERVASKVVATTEDDNLAPTVAFGTGVTLTYNILRYNVYNEAIESYLARQDNTLSTLNLFDDSYTKGNKNVVEMLASSFDTEAKRAVQLTPLTNSFYIGENRSKLIDGAQGISRVGSTTYAMVATKVKVSATATWDPTANGGEGGIAWNAPAANGTEDIYLLKIKNEYGYTGQVLIALLAGKNALEEALPADSYDMYTYKESYVHFRVFLNPTDGVKNDYNIGRNQFIHLHVQGVNGGAGLFPGYPGDPDDPEKPIDPTEDENNPDPDDPQTPVDEIDAQLKVIITVKPWEYKYNGVTLK